MQLNVQYSCFLTGLLLCSTCLWTLPAYLCSKPISLLVLAPHSVLVLCGLSWWSPWFLHLPHYRHWPYSGVRTLLTCPVRSLTRQKRGISVPWEAAQGRDSPIQHQSCQLWDWEEHWHLSAMQHFTHLPVGPCEQPSCTQSLGQFFCIAAQPWGAFSQFRDASQDISCIQCGHSLCELLAGCKCCGKEMLKLEQDEWREVLQQ